MTVKRVAGDGMKQLDVMLKSLGDKAGKVGWLDGAKYETGETIAGVAATQEFGEPSKHIPPRPFFRSTIAEKREEWKKVAEGYAKQIAKGAATTATAMEGIGLKAAGDVRKKIAAIWTPKLSERTIRERRERKAGKRTIGALNKPLIDTGVMLGALTNSVEDE